VLNDPINWIDPWGLDRLSFAEMQEIVRNNNLSGQSDELILSIAWKESRFDPEAKNKMSSATGLMQMTKAAAKDAGYPHTLMTDPSINIKAGSKYIKLRLKWSNGDINRALNGYGTGDGYSVDILRAEKCLKDSGCESCLNSIGK
jgi:hypothetical protein